MTTKKSSKSKKITADDVKVKIEKGIKEISALAKHAKEKFDSTDEATKKKVLAGVAGAVALLAGAIGLKKAFKKKK